MNHGTRIPDIPMLVQCGFLGDLMDAPYPSIGGVMPFGLEAAENVLQFSNHFHGLEIANTLCHNQLSYAATPNSLMVEAQLGV